MMRNAKLCEGKIINIHGNEFEMRGVRFVTFLEFKNLILYHEVSSGTSGNLIIKMTYFLEPGVRSL